jgi:hypothetical protein
MTARAAPGAEARHLARNLAAGVRLAFFLPVRADAFRASPLQFALLAAFNMLCWILAAAGSAGFEGELDPSALPVYLSAVMFVLATALGASLLYRQPERLVLFAVALSASDLVFELAGLALPGIAAATGRPGLVLYAYFAWSGLVSLRALLICGGRARPQVYKAIALVVVMSALAWLWLPRASPWSAPEEDAEPPPALTDERLFHLQGQLIERELAAIERSRPGAELYFLGFAPDGSADVFLREMRFVKGLFDERLATAGRSIALASSADALDQLPVASVTNLGRALARIGQAMDPEEDVLFLFLSAHGDREHRLSAVQPPLQLASLTPTALSRMLQESGIKWRVIVVSACYSGGYIEPLRDANTVVISASAADRNSFGCEHGRDFTYFGEAYFKQALAGTPSFTAAFDIAREAVGKKEAAEGLTPSQPQIWIGPAIAEQLKKLPRN